jgi:hypothetical protein
MNQLAHLTHLGLDDLPLAHRLAVAAGAGVWLTAEEERISTAHELVALAVPALVRVRTPALLADAAPEPAAGFAELACESAGALRLLDRALFSHGRDHGYLIDRWYEHAYVAADVAIHGLGREGALGARVDDAARTLGGAVIGLHRDRLAVPENLAAGIGALLVVYLAARPIRPLAGAGDRRATHVGLCGPMVIAPDSPCQSVSSWPGRGALANQLSASSCGWSCLELSGPWHPAFFDDRDHG